MRCSRHDRVAAVATRLVVSGAGRLFSGVAAFRLWLSARRAHRACSRRRIRQRQAIVISMTRSSTQFSASSTTSSRRRPRLRIFCSIATSKSRGVFKQYKTATATATATALSRAALRADAKLNSRKTATASTQTYRQIERRKIAEYAIFEIQVVAFSAHLSAPALMLWQFCGCSLFSVGAQRRLR